MSWTELVGDPAVLGRRVDEVTGRLAAAPGRAAVPPRTAASLTHQALVARLLAPLVGALLTTGALPVCPPERVHLHLRGGDPVPLAFTAPRDVPCGDPAAGAAALAGHWLEPVVAPLAAAVQRHRPVSPRVLAGNVVSALAGAVALTGAARRDLRRPAAALLDALLVTAPLAGTAVRRPGGRLVRRSCCLLARLPGAGTCGDCVLNDPARPRRAVGTDA